MKMNTEDKIAVARLRSKYFIDRASAWFHFTVTCGPDWAAHCGVEQELSQFIEEAKVLRDVICDKGHESIGLTRDQWDQILPVLDALVGQDYVSGLPEGDWLESWAPTVLWHVSYYRYSFVCEHSGVVLDGEVSKTSPSKSAADEWKSRHAFSEAQRVINFDGDREPLLEILKRFSLAPFVVA